MSDTLSDPVTLPLDTSNDFDIECEVDEIVHGEHQNPCANPAVWQGTPPCGHAAFFCEVHHSDSRSFVCNLCPTGQSYLLATYEWIRL